MSEPDGARHTLLPRPTSQQHAKGEATAMHDNVIPVPMGNRSTTLRSDRRTIGSRSFDQGGGPIMYSIFQAPGLSLTYAEARRQEMVAEADKDRLSSLALVARGRRRFALAGAAIAVRVQLGALLVRAGEVLQGSDLVDANEVCPPVGTLRGAR